MVRFSAMKPNARKQRIVEEVCRRRVYAKLLTVA
jgi:hypothetical protein